MVIRPNRESATGWTRGRKAARASSHDRLNEPGWARNVFWLPAGREEGVRCARTQVHARQTGRSPAPDVTRWIQMGDGTDRLPQGKSASESTTEMTGTNYTLDAARNGPEKQRQLLREERLADGNRFSLLTARANG